MICITFAVHRQRDVIPLDINGDAPESDEDAEHPVFNLEVPTSSFISCCRSIFVNCIYFQPIIVLCIIDSHTSPKKKI